MSTESYENAKNGLKWTRRYKSRTFFFRRASRWLLKHILGRLETLAVKIGVVRKQNTLLWTRVCSKGKAPSLSPSSGHPHPSTPFPTIELEEWAPSPHPSPHGASPTAPDSGPRASYIPRSRAGSDLSLCPPSASSPGRRISNESSLPLLPPPPAAYAPRRHSNEGCRSPKARVSFEDTALYEPGQGSCLDLRAASHSGQGYRRINSEPEIPPLAPSELRMLLQSRDINDEEAGR